MIHNTCPCCGIDRLPHLTDCTFGSDAPEAADDFDEVLGLRDEIARLRITDAERFTLREVRDIYADQDDDPQCGEIAAVIDGLLERTKGGER